MGAAVVLDEGEGSVPSKQANMHNQIGQKLGSKGQRTRIKLIEATLILLEETGLRDVSVVDVARAAGTSSATFYVYFKDVADVVLAALDLVGQGPLALEELLRRDWSGGEGRAKALEFVEAYCAFWAEHRTVFRARNLAAEEGDERFYHRRAVATRPLLDAMADQISKAQNEGRVPKDLSPLSVGGTLAMMLERLAAIGPSSGGVAGLSFGLLKDAAAYQMAHMFGAAD